MFALRRVFALVLLVVFSLQSSASAALANESSTTHEPPVWSQIQATISPVLGAIEQSWIVAVIEGQSQLYALVHAGPPTFPRVPHDGFRPKPTDVRAHIFANNRVGEALRVTSMHPERVNIRTERDPLLINAPQIVQSSCPDVRSRSALRPKAIVYSINPCNPISPHPSVTPIRTATPAPTPTPTPVPTPTPTPVPTPTPTPVPTPTLTPTPVPTPTQVPNTPTPMPTATPIGSSLSTATTGVNPWWTYAEKPLPGVGKAMVNVGNGNLIVQSDDVDVPERGIDLAFRRTYNSQSTHDQSGANVNGTDGAPVSLEGDGWTSSLDTHLAYNASSQTLSVYDLDGARYDYTPTSAGCAPTVPTCWGAPAGMQGTQLYSDGNCGYFWVKKSGTVYYFWSPVQPAGCEQAAYAGRLQEIMGRNHDNNIIFSYQWTNGDASNPQHLTEIVAQHSDGDQLILNFQVTGSGNFTQLASIVRPDGQSILYTYDPTGANLVSVTRPGNATDETYHSSAITQLTEQYAYYAGTHALQVVESPRYVWSSLNAPSNPEGGYYGFAYTANNPSGQLTAFNDYEVVNFTPGDGTGVQLQPSVLTGWNEWRTEAISYASGSTAINDSTGHSTTYLFDEEARVTATSDWTGSIWLVSQTGWNSSNEVTDTIDPRGSATGNNAAYQTKYGYDANGNTLYVQQPWVSTNLGTGMPTSRYAYDQYNNVTAYCDQNDVWTTGVTACAPGTGATSYTYDYSDASEPYGKLTDTYTPLGYHHHITYDQGEPDYGLPTTVAGDSIAQSDGTTRTPTQTYGYNAYGDLTSYNKGNGAWAIAYDAMHRDIERTDPDSVSDYTCYNVDGTIALQRSAAQYAADGDVSCGSIVPANSAGVSYVYDADANAVIERHHHGCLQLSGCPTGVTTKWYDGGDRLIEVSEPHDPRATYSTFEGAGVCTWDTFPYNWMTRYMYDYTASQGNATESVGNSGPIRAYGQLFETQEYLPTNASKFPTCGATPSSAWTPERGTSFDALDRTIAQYEVAFGSAPKLANTYDASQQVGLLSSTVNASGQTAVHTYDADGHIASTTFTNDPQNTPGRSYTYDPDGRSTSVASTVSGTASSAYDADGRLVQVTEPTVNSSAPEATLTYGYAADGMKQSLSVSSSQLSQSNLEQYSYRADGAVENETVQYGGTLYPFTWTYTAAGRELTQSDPYASKIVSMDWGAAVSLQAKQYTYDQYGRPSRLVLPESFTFANEAYDEENGLTSYDALDAYGTKRFSWGNAYDVRGDLVTDGMTWNAASTTNPRGFTGAAVGGQVGQTSSESSDTFDLRSGMKLSAINPEVGEGAALFSYDVSGRRTGSVYTWASTVDGAPTKSGTYMINNYLVTDNQTSAFDPENNIVAITGVKTCSDQVTSSSGGASGTSSRCPAQLFPGAAVAPVIGTASLLWGPDARLRYSSWNGGLAIHYDGTLPLFTDDATDGVEIYLGDLGYITSASGLTVYDRDQSGTVVATHTGTAFSAWSAVSHYTLTQPWIWANTEYYIAGSGTSGCGESLCNNPSLAAPVQYNGQLTASTLLQTRTDGFSIYSIPNFTFQGVRAYDDTSSQWVTPDFYSGDVHDPTSQRPFVWNANNPVSYSDPSGYDSGGLAAACALNRCEGGAVDLPKNTDFYVRGSGAIGPFGVTVTHTAGGVNEFSGGEQLFGSRKAAGIAQIARGLFFKNSGAVRKGIGKSALASLSASATVGIIAPKNDSNSEQVLNDQHTWSVQGCYIICVEFSSSPSGGTFGVGIGTEGGAIAPPADSPKVR